MLFKICSNVVKVSKQCFPVATVVMVAVFIVPSKKYTLDIKSSLPFRNSCKFKVYKVAYMFSFTLICQLFPIYLLLIPVILTSPKYVHACIQIGVAIFFIKMRTFSCFRVYIGVNNRGVSDKKYQNINQKSVRIICSIQKCTHT